jgi:hypothetical protein
MKTEACDIPSSRDFQLTERHQVILRHLIASSIESHYKALDCARDAVECGQINDDLSCLYSLRAELQKYDDQP